MYLEGDGVRAMDLCWWFQTLSKSKDVRERAGEGEGEGHA